MREGEGGRESREWTYYIMYICFVMQTQVYALYVKYICTYISGETVISGNG